MKLKKAFAAAVDWGTTSFRLWLLDVDGNVLSERRSDEGLLALNKSDFSRVLETHLAGLGAAADLPVVICGMAGAAQGWLDAGYQDVPISFETIASAAVRVDAVRPVHIMSGLAQRLKGFPDVLRGEETKMLGLHLAGQMADLVVMPGTHPKWVELSQLGIQSFMTCHTGELFSVLGEHSILRHSLNGAHSICDEMDSFLDAVTTVADNPSRLTRSLFSVRSAAILEPETAANTKARLSGYLIGAEIAEGRRSFGTARSVCLMAGDKHRPLYEAALSETGFSCVMFDAEDAVLAGLTAAARQLYTDGCRSKMAG